MKKRKDSLESLPLLYVFFIFGSVIIHFLVITLIVKPNLNNTEYKEQVYFDKFDKIDY
jgi:hypothetical protein